MTCFQYNRKFALTKLRIKGIILFMRLTGSQIIIKLLEKQGISMVAGIPGGSILPFYDELAKSSIRHILVRQEQAAGFIAQGIAQ